MRSRKACVDEGERYTQLVCGVYYSIIQKDFSLIYVRTTVYRPLSTDEDKASMFDSHFASEHNLFASDAKGHTRCLEDK